MAITKRVSLLRDYEERAARRRKYGRKTNRFSTGSFALDSYLGGGFGRKEGSEIVLLFGPTKVGKSFLALNLVRTAIMNRERVGLMVLEDDGEDTFNRLEDMLGADKRQLLMGDNLYITPEENLDGPWKLTELLKDVERWFTEEHLDLVLLDHLQFAFENAEALRGENEYIAQRVFMRDLSQMMKRISKDKGKTLILVSHVNKDGSARGVGKIVGSSAIAAAATKIIGVERASEHRQVEITLWGSRHTDTPDYSFLGGFDKNSIIEEVRSERVHTG